MYVRRRRIGRTAVGFLGVAATLLLHSLLFMAAIWGEGQPTRHPKLPDAVGGGANSGKPDGESTERQITVLLTPEFSESKPTAEPAPKLPEPDLHPSIIAITGLDALPLPAVKIEPPGEDPQDQEAQLMASAKYAGMYESQIRARIERAWELPSSGRGSVGLSCRVNIHQRSDGSIDEASLDLSHCEGPADWQQSLVNAIFTASPLPAPPHPSVFVDSFSMVFRSSEASNGNQIVQR